MAFIPMMSILDTHSYCDLLALFKEGEEKECYGSIAEWEWKLRFYLMDHPVRRQSIAEAGLRRARTNHTWDARFDFAFRSLRMLS